MSMADLRSCPHEEIATGIMILLPVLEATVLDTKGDPDQTPSRARWHH